MKALSITAWASLITLTWFLILDWVEFGNIQLYALIFFGVIALVTSMVMRGDEVRRRGQVLFLEKENLAKYLDGRPEAPKKEKVKPDVH